MSVEAIKREVSVSDLLSRFGIQVPQKSHGSVSLRCPLHADKSPSASIHNNRLRCFTCQVSLDCLDLVMQFRSCGFVEAKEWLVREYGIVEEESEWGRFEGARKKKEPVRDPGDERQAFLDMFHGRYWRWRDEHPEAVGKLERVYRESMQGFDKRDAAGWYRHAMERLEACIGG